MILDSQGSQIEIETPKESLAQPSKYVRNDEGLFTCPHCDKVTTRQNTMFYHLKKHAGILDYKCSVPGCTKAFIQKSGLQQHMNQVHQASGPTIFTCPHEGCDHTCQMKSNMVIHIARKHSPQIPVYSGTCTGCNKTFKSATAYYYHAAACAGLAT